MKTPRAPKLELLKPHPKPTPKLGRLGSLMRSLYPRYWFWFLLGLLLGLGLYLLNMGGCAIQAEPFHANNIWGGPNPDSGSKSLDYLLLTLRWISALCIIAGILGAILSRWGPASVFISTKLAVTCAISGILTLICCALFIEPLAEHIVLWRWVIGILVGVAAVVALIPYIHGWRNYITGTKCLRCPANTPAGVSSHPGVVAAPAGAVPEEDGA